MEAKQITKEKTDKEIIAELEKKNDDLMNTLKKREEQLEENSRIIADFNEKNQELREEVDSFSSQILELQSKLDKKVPFIF